jgi:GDP-mannose 6-dehydrogenase
VLVVGLNGSTVATALAEHVREDQFVLDLVNLPIRDRLRGSYFGLCW